MTPNEPSSSPKAPSDALRLEANRIYARLDLIIEFRPWLEYIKRTKPTTSPFNLLWETFALGASLATLLNLLGSSSPRDLTIDPDKPDLGLELPHREKYFANFIQRIQLLEREQKIPFGEVLRVQDLFGATSSGFAKVLKTVGRVLDAVQDSFPGIFVLPSDAALLREEYIRELLETEREHITTLRMTGDSARLLSEGMRSMNSCLECLFVNCPLLRQYHDRVLQLLEVAAKTTLKEDWEQIFAFEAEARKTAVGAYRSICAHFLDLADLLQEYLDDSQPFLASYTQILLNNVSVLLTRTSRYSCLLKKILSVTSPAESATYDALCNAAFHSEEMSENLDEMGHLVRTMRSARIFKGRVFTWPADVDPSELGPLLLDDLLSVDVSGTHVQYSVFLFEMMMLCCTDVDADSPERRQNDEPYQYPVRAWALGPALQRTTPLNVVHAIPMPHLRILRVSDADTFEIEWVDEENSSRTLEFYTTSAEQYEQWRAALGGFVPQRASDSGRSSLEGTHDRGGILSVHDQPLYLYRSPSDGPRPTSSGQSSLSGFSDAGSAESHGSPFSFSPQREWNFPSYDLPTHRVILKELDLTGKVTKLDIYPFDSGSAADIYRGVLNDPQSVAIKIFRRMHSEPQTLEETCTSLYEEARSWKHLHHPNILPFLGISLDIGLSPALISPLCVFGPIMKYLQHTVKEPNERLQMTIAVADGLAYLHSQDIVHGNLCTKKVLIDGNGSPVICGHGVFKALRPSANTTSLLPPIRFAAPECFSVEASTSSARTTSRDVYSFSMVTLEILSGLEPYHHLPTEHAILLHILRGDRPIRTHLDQRAVTNRIWRLLNSLWSQNPSSRPNMADVVSSLNQIRDNESNTDEDPDPDLVQPEAPSPRHDNEDKASSGEETAFEDPSLPDIVGRDLTGRITQDDQYPFAGGGNSNVYRGKLSRSDGRRIRVAIKMIRVSDDGSGQLEDILRRLRREVDVWARLKHKNILPFFGVCDDLAPTPVLISPFYKFGHIGAYLRKYPETKREALVCGVASGLDFLHANNVVHGDLKVQNVLIDKRGAPCICDFGISKITNRRGFTTSSVGTAPYMAPELFFVVDAVGQEQSPSTTKSSDVYSFALLVLEILTSEPPKGRPSKAIVTAKILAQLQPKREDYDVRTVKAETWVMLDQCWNFKPQLRPPISQVHHELNTSFN
ncbi:putative TKL/TKL-ccin protein kinase [Mycena venus]|uniref:Putative TKL/TKL-ccin protein kinase n=1 Tax=Mycena venus TaxID=2733690 RepID=A0A8H7DAQ8_9AGAR|nr:putative TKL/TKL-ccin protein kinase [Mycena venus]